MATRVASRRPAEEQQPTPAEPKELGPGSRLGRYELLKPLASGGMAQVWVATQSGAHGFRKTVALKTIRPDRANDTGFREMFLDEARLASGIHHANVVEVLDLGVEGTTVFQAMPLVEGAALSTLVRSLERERMPLGLALRIVLDMLRGLHAAHELCDEKGTKLGLVHRDVSPQNLLVGIDGVAKLSDFGIAKAFGRIANDTEAGAVKGKVRYLAPELLESMPPSPQSDLFACGVVLWELLTGEALFRARTFNERLGEEVRDPRTVVPSLPTRLTEITLRALSADPFARHESARAFADELEIFIRSHDAKLQTTQQELADWVSARLAGHPLLPSATAMTDASATVTIGQPEKKSRKIWLFLAGATPVLVLAAVVLSRRGSPPTQQPEPAAFPPPPVVSIILAAPSTSVSTATSVATPPPRFRKPTKPKPEVSAGAKPVFRNPYE